MIDINKEIELSQQVKKGDMKAANELVKANLRFVISVAKQYQNKGLPLVDLIQEGNIGLIEAAKRYDESKGFRFISYAVWWIRQSIIHAISEQCRTVRIPMSQVVYMNKINKAFPIWNPILAKHITNVITIEPYSMFWILINPLFSKTGLTATL